MTSQASSANSNNPSNSADAIRGPKVDMMAIAQATQRSDALASRAHAIKVIAPAKVNLFLGIGALREDGYHQATSVLHAINLHDVVRLRLLPGAKDTSGLTVRVTVDAREGIAPLEVAAQDNIAYKAATQLAACLGRTVHETLDIHLEKHIPSQAGLGGGSSDAAATLVGAARLWGVEETELLEEIARGLGSDVAFFLHGGCACFGGTGELFEHQIAPMKNNVVLVKPAEGVSTAQAYQAFDQAPISIDPSLKSKAQQATHAQEVPLFNNLAPASERVVPLLAEIKTWLFAQQGVEKVLLCGSGSTTFAVCSSFEDACRVSAAARSRGWWARVTAFSGAKAAVIPRS